MKQVTTILLLALLFSCLNLFTSSPSLIPTLVSANPSTTPDQHNKSINVYMKKGGSTSGGGGRGGGGTSSGGGSRGISGANGVIYRGGGRGVGTSSGGTCSNPLKGALAAVTATILTLIIISFSFFV